MSSSLFFEKAIEPTDEMLDMALGEARKYWRDLQEYLAAQYGTITLEWKYYGRKSGWILKTFLKKRNLFFTNPQKGFCRLTFVFGDRAVAAVQQSDLPQDLKKELAGARKYAEGRGLSVELKNPNGLKNIKKLIDIKIRH